jgi:PPOX class probable F420-dependent enzyme
VGVSDPKLEAFRDHKYISLETFKKNGQGVKTPVWFVLHNGALYVYTEADSWKVRRIRNDPRVRVAVCNIRGDIKGELLDRKYVLKMLFNILSRLNRHTLAMIKIEAA